jgi:hypothetical protein
MRQIPALRNNRVFLYVAGSLPLVAAVRGKAPASQPCRAVAEDHGAGFRLHETERRGDQMPCWARDARGRGLCS